MAAFLLLDFYGSLPGCRLHIHPSPVANHTHPLQIEEIAATRPPKESGQGEERF